MYRTTNSLDEYRTNAWHFSEIYTEYKLPKGMKLTASVSQAFGDKKYYDRTYYDGNIADGVVSRIEDRYTNVQPTLALKLQATF